MTRKNTINVRGIDRSELDEMIEHWERFAKCYFWSPPSSASGRRSEERRHYRNIDFLANEIVVSYSVEVSCSCRNYYCNRTLIVGGEVKKQGLRYLKKLANQGVFEAAK